MDLASTPCVVFDTDTVLTALEEHDIKTRFIFVLENEAHPKYRQLPRFTIGGPKANLDPTRVPLDQLHEISRHNHGAIDLRRGWSKLHHFIYVLGPHTDEYGFEYRSDWSNGELGPDDEPWGKCRVPGSANVRRRLWITSCVKDDDVDRGKDILSNYLSHIMQPRRLLRGELCRREPGYIGHNWNSRHIVLWDDRLEIYPDAQAGQEAAAKMAAAKAAGQPLPSSTENVKGVETIFLRDVSFARVYGDQLGRHSGSSGTQSIDSAFLLRDRRSDNVVAAFDAVDQRSWRRWTTALTYSVAINSHNVDFPPFEMGPPSDDMSPNRVLVYGNILKMGHFRKNWRQRFFHLTPFELVYYKGDVIKGRIVLHGATLLANKDPDSLEFTVRALSGHQLTMQADSISIRDTWESSMAKQIRLLDVLYTKYSVSSAGNLVRIGRATDEDRESLSQHSDDAKHRQTDGAGTADSNDEAVPEKSAETEEPMAEGADAADAVDAADVVDAAEAAKTSEAAKAPEAMEGEDRTDWADNDDAEAEEEGEEFENITSEGESGEPVAVVDSAAHVPAIVRRDSFEEEGHTGHGGQTQTPFTDSIDDPSATDLDEFVIANSGSESSASALDLSQDHDEDDCNDESGESRASMSGIHKRFRNRHGSTVVQNIIKFESMTIQK